LERPAKEKTPAASVVVEAVDEPDNDTATPATVGPLTVPEML
jgi:hypothetical protein